MVEPVNSVAGPSFSSPCPAYCVSPHGKPWKALATPSLLLPQPKSSSAPPARMEADGLLVLKPVCLTAPTEDSMQSSLAHGRNDLWNSKWCVLELRFFLNHSYFISHSISLSLFLHREKNLKSFFTYTSKWKWYTTYKVLSGFCSTFPSQSFLIYMKGKRMPFVRFQLASSNELRTKVRSINKDKTRL